MENWIYWAIVGAAFTHILEEYLGGWLQWVQRYAKGVTITQFLFVNSLFLVLCIIASIGTSLIFKLSIASLIFVNAIIHIVPTIAFKHYSPGILSAAFLYIPLSVYAYFSAIKFGKLTITQYILTIFIGIFLMVLPIFAQYLRILLCRNGKLKKIKFWK